MMAITDHINMNIILFMMIFTFLVISFRQAAMLLFRAGVLVAGLLTCAGTAVFSVNFMLLGINSPASFQWQDINTLMYCARSVFGGVIIIVQVMSFITWQRGQGGKWLCVGATAISVFMSVYTFHADITRSAANAARSNVKGSVKYNTMAGELERLKELRDGIVSEKKERMDALRAKDYITKSNEDRQYYDEQLTIYNEKIKFLADEFEQYEEQKAKGGMVVSTKGTFENLAKDAVFFFALDEDFWQKRIEMMFQYLMIASISLLADCAAISFMFFGLGLLDEVKKKDQREAPFWLLQLRPKVVRVATDVRDHLKQFLARIKTSFPLKRYAGDVKSDATGKPAGDVDASVKNDVSIDVTNRNGDVSQDDAVPEIKIHGVTVKGFDDVASAKKFMVDAYQEKPFYRRVYRKLGISPNTSSATMLKAVLDEAGIKHGRKKKRSNGKVRPFTKSLERAVASMQS